MKILLQINTYYIKRLYLNFIGFRINIIYFVIDLMKFISKICFNKNFTADFFIKNIINFKQKNYEKVRIKSNGNFKW